MESHVREFVRQCPHCVDVRAGEVVPRPHGDTVHGTAPGEVVHFDFLYVGSSGPEFSEGLPEEDGFRYILVIWMIYRISFPWRQPRLAQPRLRLSRCLFGARLWGCRVCG